MMPGILLDGARDSRALFVELVTDEMIAAVITDAMDRHDVMAIVVRDLLFVRDRATTETDPQLPQSLRWLRSASRGSWIVAVRESDGARVRARMRMVPLSRGGDA